MYLSELILRAEYAARIIPRDSYGWHKVLWRFFQGREKRDFLYRVEQSGDAVKILMLSVTQPTPPTTLPPRIFRCKEIPEAFLGHKRYRFCLRANPTHCRKLDKVTGEQRTRGLRAPITDEQKLIEWLARKGTQHGFCIPHAEQWPQTSCPLSICYEGRRSFRKKGLKAAHHSSVEFRGILEVEDPAAFRQAFETGIGSAKAFGFGLLMLQPIS